MVITYTKSAPYNTRSNLILHVLKGILTLRYLDEVREKEGGTYHVSVMANIDHFPKAEKAIQMMFDAEPERSAHLKSIIYREIDKIVANGPAPEDLDKVVRNLLKDREQGKLYNGYWMGRIIEYYVHSVNNDSPDNFEKILESLTVEEIRNFTAGFIQAADLVDVVFLPVRK